MMKYLWVILGEVICLLFKEIFWYNYVDDLVFGFWLYIGLEIGFD